jgi:outer membrane lipoprotein-sorting protein
MRHWGILFCLGFSVTSISWSYTLEQVLLEMEKKEAGVVRIGFEFKQTIFFKEANVTSKTQGDALFEKPKKFKISKSIPQRQVTLSDGAKVWVVNPEMKQVWIGAATQWSKDSGFPDGVLPLQDYVADLKKGFSLSLKKNTDGGEDPVCLMATPKTGRGTASMDIVISTNSWMPEKIIYRSDSAVVTTSLSSVELNPVVSDKTFTYTPAKDMEIISLN